MAAYLIKAFQHKEQEELENFLFGSEIRSEIGFGFFVNYFYITEPPTPSVSAGWSIHTPIPWAMELSQDAGVPTRVYSSTIEFPFGINW